jgi:hypothetical protein
VRGDLGTVEHHLAAIEADLPELAAAYRLRPGDLEPVRPALPPDTVAALRALLGADADAGRGARPTTPDPRPRPEG